METDISKRNEDAIAMLARKRAVHYGRATVPASVNDKLQVKWHLPGGIATTNRKHALMIARRINLLMGGNENGVR